jgi:hypothetical protein
LTNEAYLYDTPDNEWRKEFIKNLFGNLVNYYEMESYVIQKGLIWPDVVILINEIIDEQVKKPVHKRLAIDELMDHLYHEEVPKIHKTKLDSGRRWDNRQWQYTEECGIKTDSIHGLTRPDLGNENAEVLAKYWRTYADVLIEKYATPSKRYDDLIYRGISDMARGAEIETFQDKQHAMNQYAEILDSPKGKLGKNPVRTVKRWYDNIDWDFPKDDPRVQKVIDDFQKDGLEDELED